MTQRLLVRWLHLILIHEAWKQEDLNSNPNQRIVEGAGVVAAWVVVILRHKCQLNLLFGVDVIIMMILRPHTPYTTNTTQWIYHSIQKQWAAETLLKTKLEEGTHLHTYSKYILVQYISHSV